MIINKYSELNVYGIIIRNVKVKREECPIVSQIEKYVREKWTVEKLLSNPIVKAYRSFFWSLDVDPTKERPSSEALVRRLLGGKRLPRINNVVDAMNAASVETLVTFSVFDLDKIKPPLLIRYANGGEILRVIGGEEFVFPKNFPLMEDGEGKIIAAVIFRDGEETKVTEQTKNIILVGYVPKIIEKSVLRASTKRAAEIIVNCAGGEITTSL